MLESMGGREYQLRPFEVGELAGLVESLTADLGSATKIQCEVLSSDGVKSTKKIGINELKLITQLGEQFRDVTAMFGKDVQHMLSLCTDYSDHLRVIVMSTDDQAVRQLLDQVESALRLQPYEVEARPRVETRLASIEQRLRDLEAPRLMPKLRCFLSSRSDASAKLLAAQVKEFLELLGVVVVRGNVYEPLRLSDKVPRLLEGCDFVVCLVTESGQSTWTRDEIVSGYGQRLVIPLVEKGAKFEPAILGDLEHIPFSRGHVGDAFLGLAQGVVYLRHQREVAAGADCRTSEK